MNVEALRFDNDLTGDFHINNNSCSTQQLKKLLCNLFAPSPKACKHHPSVFSVPFLLFQCSVVLHICASLWPFANFDLKVIRESNLIAGLKVFSNLPLKLCTYIKSFKASTLFTKDHRLLIFIVILVTRQTPSFLCVSRLHIALNATAPQKTMRQI